ncbi:MAG: hypothetical protein K8E24_006275 [Methanobacterium paludis]|nr:hypothetical protein [Methanobacterium paludis]
MISESIAWYMLLWVFLTVFFGALNPLGYLVGMVVMTAVTAFICATSPLLNPNHSIMMQTTFAFVGIVGSILLLMY